MSRAVPRSDQAAVQICSMGLTMLRSFGGDMPPSDDDHGVVALDVVGQASKPELGQLLGLLLVGLLHVQDRRVIELREHVDEQLPVGVDLRAVAVVLVISWNG